MFGIELPDYAGEKVPFDHDALVAVKVLGEIVKR